MKDLIEALIIFLKYSDDYNPTNCSHDERTVSVAPALVSDEDKRRLDELGFHPDDDIGRFYSTSAA